MRLRSLIDLKMKGFDRKEILILLLCLLIGFALRFYTFDQKSLWVDEIHTFNESRFGFEDQMKYYVDNPTFLYPPLFFLLSHQFYPFAKPERDLRIIPLVFGTLSIPMIYLLSRLFSRSIALPCTLSLTFMTYQISLSQEGRSYSMLLFLGMAGLYFFIKYFKTLKRKYLFPASLFFAVSIFTGYTSILYIVFAQLFWLYRFREDSKKPDLYSFLTFNGLILILCSPWFIFLISNYHGQSVTAMNPFEIQYLISFWNIFYSIFYDWTPHAPLMIISITLLVLLPLFSKERKNAIILLLVFVLPIGSLYLYTSLFNITHFITSRYLINFLPPLFIALYLSLGVIETKLEKFRYFIRLKSIFTIIFIASNLVILPPYYRSGKQDFRGLANYLKGEIRDGDKIIVGTIAYVPGILHYFGVYPKDRHYIFYPRKVSEKEKEYRYYLSNQNNRILISYSETFWAQYALEGSRLWIVVDDTTAREIKKNTPSVLKGYFDGSFANFERFPVDASLYLFLWDPKSPNEKGIDMPME